MSGPGESKMSAPRLLESTEDITLEWLEAVLRVGGAPGVRVQSFTVEPIGAGNVSDTVRIDLSLSDAGDNDPRSIVCKFRPSLDLAHAHGVASGAYRCEAGAYRLLRSVSGACRIPRALWLDGTDDNINLVMEDLSRSTRAGDQIAGCGPDDARAVMTELGRLHREIAYAEEADAPDWAVRMPASGDYWVPVIARAAPIVAERFADTIDPDHIDLVGRAAKLARAWHDLRHSRWSLTHGDPRVDNILFSGQGRETRATLIDWQVAGVRNALHDVGYFLSGSLSVEDRRVHERELLAHYAAEYGAASADQLLDDYRVQLVSGLMTTAAATAVLPDLPHVNRLLIALLERNCAAVADWDSLSAIAR